jgi:glycine cleavage system H lipoate-binding protein
MVVFLAILTISILVIIDWIRLKKRKAVLTDQPVPTFRGDLQSRVFDRYFHPGHCWIMARDRDAVTAGVDDLAQRLIGQLDAVEIPPAGSFIKQGAPFITLRRGRKSLTQVAPLTGTIEKFNEKLVSSPRLVNHSPYDQGWVAVIKPANFQLEVRNLLKGLVAERWEEAVRMQLFRWFTPTLGTVLQDGGKFADNISDALSDEEWARLTHEFFPSVPNNAHSNESDKGVLS